MAVKDINDLTRPLSDLVGEQGEKAVKRKIQLAKVRANRAAGMTADEAKAAAERGDYGDVGQDKERMDFLATPLVTPTDFNLAYNEPGALDYADRIDDSKKTSKPSLATRAIKGIISAVNPLKKGKFLMNLAMSSPDFAKNVITKSDDVASTVSKSKVNDEFLEFFEDQKKLVNRLGRVKASSILDEFNKLDETFLLGAKSSELVEYLATKGIKTSIEDITRGRSLYKKYKGIELTGKRGVSQFIDFDDSKVTNILDQVALGDINKTKAAELLEKMFPKSGFISQSPYKASGRFSKFYQKYVDQISDPELKKIAIEGPNKETPRFYFNQTSVGEKIPSNALPVVRYRTIFDDTGKNFKQIKTSFLDNTIAKTLINKTKNLFKDKSTQIFDVDHIKAPRFGGTNAEKNLRLITKADHTSLKALPTNKTLATDVVLNKTSFENQYYNLSIKLIDNIKNNNYAAADKIAESLRVMANNFKSTYKNIDFIVGQPHVAIKTGDNTAKYIKYGDDVKLSSKQKKYIENNNLLPEQSNLPNAGKPIEKQAEDIYQGYLQIYNLIGEIPSGPMIAGDTTSIVRKGFSGMKDGGIVGISHLIRPL